MEGRVCLLVGIPYIYSGPDFQISFFRKPIKNKRTNTNLPAILNPFPHILNIIPGNLDHVLLHYFLLSRKTFQYTLFIYSSHLQVSFSQIFLLYYADFLISKSPNFPALNFENRFLANSLTNSDSSPHILRIYPYLCGIIDKFIIPRQ